MFQTNLASIRSYCVDFISEREAPAIEKMGQTLLSEEGEGSYLKLTDRRSFNLEKYCITAVTYHHFWVHQYQPLFSASDCLGLNCKLSLYFGEGNPLIVSQVKATKYFWKYVGQQTKQFLLPILRTMQRSFIFHVRISLFKRFTPTDHELSRSKINVVMVYSVNNYFKQFPL